MNAEDLCLFAKVVDMGSFNQAAASLNMSSSALSKRISRLESQVSLQLIYRTTRRLSLTEAGEALYHHAKTVSHEIQDAKRVLGQYTDGLHGHVKMSVPTISGELLLAEAVAEFCQQNPNVSVDLRLENHFVDLLKDGVDLAIRTGELQDSSMIAQRIIQSNWALCASPKYIDEHMAIVQPEDLQDHNCLTYTYQGNNQNLWQFSKGDEKREIFVSGSMCSNNSHALREAAIAGFGIVYLPQCCLYESLASKQLSIILPNWSPRSIGVYAVYPYTRHLPLHLRALIAHIKNAYQEKTDYFS